MYTRRLLAIETGCIVLLSAGTALSHVHLFALVLTAVGGAGYAAARRETVGFSDEDMQRAAYEIAVAADEMHSQQSGVEGGSPPSKGRGNGAERGFQ